MEYCRNGITTKQSNRECWIFDNAFEFFRNANQDKIIREKLNKQPRQTKGSL